LRLQVRNDVCLIHGNNHFMIKIVGILSGALTSISMIPQFSKLIKKKDSKDISIGMLIVLLLGVAGWTFYGYLRADPILIITNSFSVFIDLLTIILAIKYRKH